MNTGQAFPGTHTRRRVALTCAVGAVVEALMVWRFGWSGALPAYLYFGAVAVVISASDLVVRRVPNHVVLPAYIVGPTSLAVASVVSGQWWTLARAGTAMAILAALFLVFALASSGGMGLGDCKWAGIVGLYLGWLGWDALSTGMLLGFLAAALFVIGRRIVSSPGTRVLLPFAPFMAGGALAAVFTFSGR